MTTRAALEAHLAASEAFTKLHGRQPKGVLAQFIYPSKAPNPEDYDLATGIPKPERVTRNRYLKQSLRLAMMDATTALQWLQRTPALPVLPKLRITREEIAEIRTEQDTIDVGNGMTARIQNSVYATYLNDVNTGRRATISLTLLQQRVAHLGFKLTRSMFPKLMFRCPPPFSISCSFFEGGRIVDTGSVNRDVSRLIIDKLVRYLQEEIGLQNLEMDRRVCENLVASCDIPFYVDLIRLQAQRPDIVQRRTRFVAAIVDMPNIRAKILVFPEGPLKQSSMLICIGARNHEDIVEACKAIFPILQRSQCSRKRALAAGNPTTTAAPLHSFGPSTHTQ